MVRREQPDVFDRGVWVRSRWRALRRGLISVVLVALFVENFGLPEVRLRDGSRGRSVVYLGVQGQRSSGRSMTAPLVVLRKLDRPLVDYAADAIDGLLERR